MIGLITFETHRHARVRLNGVDISSRCFAADDINGFADCYALNEEGRKYVIGKDDEQHAATERLYGIVEIDFPNGLD